MEYEIYHHGIKGQKWGIRRYQNKDGSLTPKGRERYQNTKAGMSAYAGTRPTWDQNNPSRHTYGIDQRIEVVETTNPETGRRRLTVPTDPEIMKGRFRQEYLDDPDSVFDKQMEKINLTYGDEDGTRFNCSKVTSAMIMARKGYDFDAGRATTGDTEAFRYWFDDVEKTSCDNLSSAIDQKFSKTKNGSYGIVDMRNTAGGGHVFNWERNSKGEFNLYEGQLKVGEKYTGSSPKECFDKYIQKRPWFSAESTVRVYDMTDAKPNLNHMAEDSVLRITDDATMQSKLFDKKTKQTESTF